MMRNLSTLFVLGLALYFVGSFASSALAQPNAAMMQVIQFNLDSQRAIASHQQATWQNQTIQATVRQHQEFASRNGGNQGGGFIGFQDAPAIRWGAAGNPFMPAGRLEPNEMAYALQELNGVALRDLDGIERAQCRAAARRLRLSLRYGYGMPQASY